MRKDKLMGTKEIIAQDVTKYSLVLYTTEFLGMIRFFVMARFLGPYLYGTWSALSVLLNYLNFVHLGAMDGMSKEIPYHRGKGDLNTVKIIKGSGITIITSMGILTLALISIASFMLKCKYPPVVITGLRVVAVLAFLQVIYLFYDFTLAADNNFTLKSRTALVFTLINVPLTILLVILMNINGLFIALLITYTFRILYLLWHYRIDFAITGIYFKTILNLIKIGFPLLLRGLTNMLFVTADRLMILAFLPSASTQLGYYGIAIIASRFISYFPMAVSQVMFPRLLEKYGERDNIEDIKPYLFKPLLIMAYSTPLLIGGLLFILPLLVRHVIPEYVAGIYAVKILVLGSFFATLHWGMISFITALNKQGKALVFNILSIFVAVILNYIFINRGMGINGVALATAFSFFFLCTCQLVYGMVHCSKGIYNLIIELIRLYIPFIYLLIIFLLLDHIWLLDNPNFMQDAYYVLTRLCLFGIFSLPLLYYMNRETGIIRILLETCEYNYIIGRFLQKSICPKN
jgi:O-antigen/teichoic acid export membrane protein